MVRIPTTPACLQLVQCVRTYAILSFSIHVQRAQYHQVKIVAVMSADPMLLAQSNKHLLLRFSRHHLPRLLLTDVYLCNIDNVVIAHIVVVSPPSSPLPAVAVSAHHVARQEELFVPRETLPLPRIRDQMWWRFRIVFRIQIDGAVGV